MVGWLVSWLVGEFVGWLVGWLVVGGETRQHPAMISATMKLIVELVMEEGFK